MAHITNSDILPLTFNVDMLSIFSGPGFSLSDLENINFEPFSNINIGMDVNNEPDNFLNYTREPSIPKSQYVINDNSEFPINTNCLCIGNWNCRSIPLRLDTLIDELSHYNISLDIFVLCETRLNEEIAHLWSWTHYTMLNQYRNRDGGGVTLYIKNNFKPLKINTLSFIETDIEIISAEITTDGGKCLVTSIYRPPSGKVNIFINKLEEILISAKDNYKHIYIAGDFNIDMLKNDNNSSELMNLMSSFFCYPVVTKPTRVTDETATLIDHLWTTILFSVM